MYKHTGVHLHRICRCSEFRNRWTRSQNFDKQDATGMHTRMPHRDRVLVQVVRLPAVHWEMYVER